MTGFLRGSATATVTPFDGGVNLASLGRMMDYQMEGGTDALVLLGTTGEPSCMDEAEKELVIRYAVEHAAGRIKIIAGVGSNCTGRAVEAARRAKSLGADGVLAVTPYYNRCTQQGIFEYYSAICGENLPVIAYNVPARTGVNILPETAERLANLPNFAGLKEASGDMAQICDTMRRIRGKCDLYSGDDFLNLPILSVGGAGVISVVSNLVPRAVKSLTEAALAGRLGEAIGYADALFPLTKACFSEVNPIPVKEGLNLLGFCAGKPRPPLTPLEPRHREELLAAMRNFGLCA